MKIVKLLNCYIVILLVGLVLVSCTIGVGEIGSGSDGNADLFEEGDVETRNETGNSESVSFSLDVDGEVFEVGMEMREEITAYNVLSRWALEQGIELKTKEYDFGLFIKGIGDKIGDMDEFWLFYVNDRMANSSADTTKVEPGDTIKFEFSGNNPF